MKDLVEFVPVLTEEAYRIAESNGISRENLRQRYWDYGWDAERAVTEPLRDMKPKLWDDWKETATNNGISNTLFNMRVKKYGFTPEQAATLEVRKRGGLQCKRT